MAEDLWQRSEDCVSQPVEDSLVILDIASGQYIALNETAAAIWQLIEQPAPVSGIVANLQGSYEVDGDGCHAAVLKVLDTLDAKGLVRRVA